MGGGSGNKPPKEKKEVQKDKQKASDKSGGKKQSTDMPPIGAHAGGASKASSSRGQRKNSTQSETSFSNPEKQRKASTHQQGASSQADPKQSRWKTFKQTINPRKHQSSVDSQQDAQDVLAVTPSPQQLSTWSSYGNTGGGAAEVADSCFTPDSEANVHSPTEPFEKRTDKPPFLESSSKSPELLVDALDETPVKSKYLVERASSPLSEEDEENVTTGAGYSTQTSETQESIISRRPRETDATLLQRQISNNKKLKDQLKALQDEFSAKRKELQAKLNERDENQKLSKIKFDELSDTMKKMTEAYLTEMQTKEASNEHVKETLKTELLGEMDTTLKELTEAHQTEMETKETSFNERAQQWEKERETFELELKRMQAELLQEKERYGIALKKSVDAECELIKLREVQKDKERGEALKVQQLEAHIEKNEKTVEEVKDKLETARQTIINLNQRRKADLDELEALKEEKEVEIRKSQTTTDRANELTHEVDRLQKENDKLSKQLKGSTVKAEASQTETNQREAEILSQQGFDDKLREETDKIYKEGEAKIQALEHEHEHTIVQLNKENALKIVTLTKELRDELDKEQRSHQDVQEDMTRELKKQANKHEEEVSKIRRTLAESNQKHQKELTAQRERTRKLELKYQTELKKEREQRDGYLEETMDNGLPGSSPEQVRHKAKVEMKLEQQDQFQQKIADLQQETDYLRTQLTDQQQRAQSDLEHQRELYGQLQIQVMAKHQLSSLPTVGDDNVLPFPNHNPLTSSPSSPESAQLQSVSDHPLQSSEGPQHDSEDEVYHSLDEDNRTDSQKLEEFRQETQLLRTKLQELQTTNDQLTQAIKIALSEQPVSETGVTESADTLVHMKTMYLQQLNKAMEAQEALEESKTEKKKLALKLETLKKSLTEKIQEKDHELQQLRRGSASVEHPPTFSVDDDDDLPDDADPMVCISELKAALKSKKEQVESLRCQVNSFEQIATQHQQLQRNSKMQSMVVLKLKKCLETVGAELELAKKNTERMGKTNVELADLKQEKEDIEDNKHCLEMEMSAERERLQGLMKQLADSQSAVKSMEKTLKARPGDNPMSEDDKDREIELLTSEIHLAQIEINEYRQNAEKSQKVLADIEKQRQSLKRKLDRANQERDSLANDVLKVQVENRTQKSRLTSIGAEHEAAIEFAESLSKTIEEKHSEVADLKKNKIQIEEKLQLLDIQVNQYKEDFEQERRDRTRAAGKNVDDNGKFEQELAKLQDDLKESRQSAIAEKREKQEVIAKLEVTIQNFQQTQSQLAQAHNDFEVFLQLKATEIEQVIDEKQQLSMMYENRIKQIGAQNMQLQTQLRNEIERLKAILREQTETGTAEKLSLEDQLEKATREFKLKEKQLEIVANEKAVISSEIAQANTTSGRMGVELQAARERLEIAIADTARLHDEVMAKTAQVKQYKKQTDSFKAKVEEANTKLLKTQQELQRRHELIKTMEEDNQDQIEQAKATAESDKLSAEMDLIQSQRRVEAFERELQELRNGGEIPKAVMIEVDRRIEVEQKLLAAEAKCSELMDKCNTRYQAIEKLEGALAQHSIAIPAFSIDKIEKIPALSHQSSNSRMESPQHQQPVSRDSQLGQQQRGGYPQNRAGYEQQQTPSVSSFDANRPFTEPHSSIAPHGHVRTVSPRVHKDGAQYWEGQLPPTSQTQLLAQNRMDTGPPIRASDPGTQHNMDQHYQEGQQNQQRTNDPQQPMYQYEQGGQQNQPIQWQGGYHPNQQGGGYPNQRSGYDPNQQGVHNPNQQGAFNQDPRQNQQLQQGYAQGGPPHHGQQHHRGHHPPPRSPNYQPQAQNYPPTSYAQGNPSPYHVNQSQQPPRGMPQLQSQAPFTPQNPVQPQQMVSHQESPPTGRGQPAPEVQPTPLPRRNSKENLPNAPRLKQSSSVQENILLQGIDRDIKDAAKFVIHEGDELESMGPNAPFDPNLICPLCMRNFRVGEIQKYRKHVNTCQG